MDTLQLDAVEPRCEWCGDRHDVRQLCARAQRGMTRRSFLFLAGAGVIGAVIAPLPTFQHEVFTGQFTMVTGRGPHPMLGQMVAEAWNKIVGNKPEDSLFIDYHFARLMRDELNANLLDKK